MRINQWWIGIVLVASICAFATHSFALGELTVQNPDLTVKFNAANGKGISLVSIQDRVTGREYVPESTFFFEFAVNNGTPFQSDDGLAVTSIQPFLGGFTLVAQAIHVPLEFTIQARAENRAPAILIRLTVRNIGAGPAFVRMVAPKIRGLLPSDNPDGWMGAIPQELGSMVRLTPDPIGMPSNVGRPINPIFDPGLPTAMNTMEVASLYNPTGGGGLFFADIDGVAGSNRPPIQFTLSSEEIAGFWIANLDPGQEISLPRFAIGVHHTGDWHQAVDYYLSHQKPPGSTAVPSWFSDQGAIYSFAGGGAGGIYLELPTASLVDGAISTSFERDDNKWAGPISFSPGGLAPAGAHIEALMRNDHQEDLFVVGSDGVLYTVFQTNNGPWSDPIALTAPGFAPPGARLAGVVRDSHQEDVFVVGTDGVLYTLYEVDDSKWSNPIALTAGEFADGGAGVAAVMRNAVQEDLFVVDRFGQLWTLFVRKTALWGPWSDPIPISEWHIAPSGAPLAAASFGDSSVDLYVVGRKGDLLRFREQQNSSWNGPSPLTEEGGSPAGSGVTAVVRNSVQIDVFVTRTNGAIWTIWTDPAGEYYGPVEIAPADFASPGADLAAAVRNDHQEDLFVVRPDGSMYTVFERDNGPWQLKKPDGTPLDSLSFGGFVPPGSGIAAVRRNADQMDAFVVCSGRIRSFYELPKLLDEARELGTDIVYLWDYWETSDFEPIAHYFNKGDYIPRRDLGGATALAQGIQAVHERGGKVILYLEPFIIYKNSHIGRARGEEWGARDVFGNLYAQYADNYTMVPSYLPWQDYLVDVARHLVRPPSPGEVPPSSYGADGVLLDSWDWQLNWPSRLLDGSSFLAQDYTRGAVELTRRLRTEIRLDNPQAVVLGETNSGPMSRVWDGGLSADFTYNWWFGVINWREVMNQGRIVASPVRYASSRMNWFSNGHNLTELNQIYAAGHNLALCSNWPGTFIHENAAYIKTLVELRQAHKDALIYGQQEYQPVTGSPDTAAYLYRGHREVVLTIVNTNPDLGYSGDIVLQETEANSRWLDLLSGKIVVANNRTHLNLDVNPGGLTILSKL